jgi:hypothetical protein
MSLKFSLHVQLTTNFSSVSLQHPPDAIQHLADGVSKFFRNTRTIDPPRGAEKQKEIRMIETC